jgi:DNA-binding FadR family transcriptional regulator
MTRMHRGVHGALVQQLGLQIAQGGVRPGEAIIPDDVGRQFRAARPTVREALRVLESKGMLHIRQGLGTRVTPPEDWNLLDEDVVYWRLHGTMRDQQMRELLQMRFAVEPVAAQQAAWRRDSVALEALRAACAAIEKAEGDVYAFTEADVSFHEALLRASGNQMFTRLIGLVAVALEAREETLIQTHEHVSPEAVRTHREVVNAINNGDGNRAANITRSMLQSLVDQSTDCAPTRRLA